MAAAPTSPLDALKDPFEHSADSYHWGFFPTAGLDLHDLPVSRFLILQTVAVLIAAMLLSWESVRAQAATVSRANRPRMASCSRCSGSRRTMPTPAR